ncbi:MAG: MBL fold metallo-hydrolase, partial [Muribaculum sp.]|nr:MBL fold metallo-hydrolase [Muribaculum sp.]
MTRRGRNNLFDDSPGLFDEVEGRVAPSALPTHPDIEGYVRKVRLSGGMSRHGGGVDDMPLGPIVVKPVPNKIMFMSFGSGSSGNCSFIGDSKSGILIDAGVDPKTVAEGLAAYKIPMESVKGICITHDHSDHMRFAYALLKKHKHMSLYCTPRALNGMLRRHNVSRRLKDYQVNIYKEIPFTVDNFTITAFEVMHDGTDNVGFYVEHDDRAFAIATDLGCISERVDYYMRRADYLMIESNYDLDMLRFGSYPEYLKARIRNVNGHLDNKVTAQYLADIYTERMRYVFLCHLSHDNNTPETALAESRMSREDKGGKVGTGSNL